MCDIAKHTYHRTTEMRQLIDILLYLLERQHRTSQSLMSELGATGGVL